MSGSNKIKVRQFYLINELIFDTINEPPKNDFKTKTKVI